MEPIRLEQEAIREAKVRLLRTLMPIRPEEVAFRVVRGQYREGAVPNRPVAGYLDEDGVAPDSRTETFVALRANIDSLRWANVPFYLRAGKRMAHRVSEIIVSFRSPPQ